MTEETHANRQSGPALEAMHQFILWLIPTVEKFPRSQKFLLGDPGRIELPKRLGMPSIPWTSIFVETPRRNSPSIRPTSGNRPVIDPEPAHPAKRKQVKKPSRSLHLVTNRSIIRASLIAGICL